MRPIIYLHPPYWLFFKKTKIYPSDTIISPVFLGSPKFIQLPKKNIDRLIPGSYFCNLKNHIFKSLSLKQKYIKTAFYLTEIFPHFIPNTCKRILREKLPGMPYAK